MIQEEADTTYSLLIWGTWCAIPEALETNSTRIQRRNTVITQKCYEARQAKWEVKIKGHVRTRKGVEKGGHASNMN